MLKKLVINLMIFSFMFVAVGTAAMSIPCPVKKAEKMTRVELYLKFDEAQIVKYKAIKLEHCGKATALRQSLISEEKKLQDLQAKNADAKAIKAQHDLVNGLKNDMSELNSQYVAKLTSIMTPSQLKKFKKSKFYIDKDTCFCNGNCACQKGKPCPVSN